MTVVSNKKKAMIKGNIFAGAGRFAFGEVEIGDGLIKAVRVISEEVKEGEKYILPGFTDIHTHGCVGHDTCDGDVESIIKMAEKLGLHTLAEGVETKEQMEFMKALGCEKLQGYYYAKPIPFDEIEGHVNNERQYLAEDLLA